jgi:hypothetical protein
MPFANKNKGKIRIDDGGSQKLALENRVRLRNKSMTVFLRESRNSQGFTNASFEKTQNLSSNFGPRKSAFKAVPRSY